MLAAAVWLLAFASVALAGPPSHPRQEALDISGFNRACGAAVDSKGDVYVASAGESKIKVFDPEHNELASISNSNEPCGLAVNTKGELFVSEQGTGNVVRYKPNAYPFAGTLTYGAAEAIDSSGEAQGISADPFDDRLYIAKDSRVAVYKADGSFDINVGEGTLGEAKGVAAYTYKITGSEFTRHLFVADAEGDEVEVFSGANLAGLKLRRTIGGVDNDLDPETPEQEFGFGAAGSPVAVDWTNGHFLIFDDANSVVDEFEATGEYLDQFADPSFADAGPAGIGVFPDRNELQEIRVTANGGTFTLSFEGEATAPIPYNAKPDQVKAALEAVPAIGVGNVSTGGVGFSGGLGFSTYFVSFTEGLGSRDVPVLVADGSGLSGPVGVVLDASVTTKAEGSGPGRIYVTAGAGPGAKLLAFGPLVTPARPLLPELSRALTGASAVATDSHGNVYVVAEATVHIYGPDGKELTSFEDSGRPQDLAVDSEGNVYVIDGKFEQEVLTYYVPTHFPPTPGTGYARHEPALLAPQKQVQRVAVNPANDHVLVGRGQLSGIGSKIQEFGSAKEGSPGPTIFAPFYAFQNGVQGLERYGASGSVYTTSNEQVINVIDPTGSEFLTRIGGGASLNGVPINSKIDVDQSNGHALAFAPSPGTPSPAREFDASGAFVAEFGSFAQGAGTADIAIDNSGGPGDGNVYVAYDAANNQAQPYDLTAFGPLSYGEAPSAVTGTASGLGGGEATLNGSVDPRGFDLEECRFEHLGEDEYETNLEDGDPPFEGASSVDCAESLAEIGHGTGAVPVHAELTGLDVEGRYRFRLQAKNKYGESIGDAGLFGPPLITTRSAQPVLYDEATLRAEVNPSGLKTKYHFQFGTSAIYGQSTPAVTLAPGSGSIAINAPLTGLAEGTEYHFRIVAENEAMEVEGPDQAFTTLERSTAEACPNTEYRTGLSAQLPDCRAYELVTPADTQGKEPNAVPPGSAGKTFSNWLVKPRGSGAGESVAYFAGTLPGFEGAGDNDGYHAARGPGAHPEQGWENKLFSPTYAQYGIEAAAGNNQEGVASDQIYSLWTVAFVNVPGTLPPGHQLRTPSGFELVGQGSLGTDPTAESRFVSAGGAHVVFFSKAHLEDDAAPPGTTAIYDRKAGEGSAEVISVKPDGSPFGASEDAKYIGASEDGSAVAFEVAGTLYLHREGQTTPVVAGTHTFAGISADGTRVFYMDATFSAANPPPAGLFACDVETGPCLGGPEPPGLMEIASDSIFVSIAPDGSHVLFTSEVASEHNLYAWDGTDSDLVAVLDPRDLVGFPGPNSQSLIRWTSAAGVGSDIIGRGWSPTRATPGGDVFVFQSYAQLTAYDNEGKGEIYRYEPGAAPDERLLCVSCDPSGAPPSANAMLQMFTGNGGAHTDPTTILPNLTDDGNAVFFHSPDRLLPEDANSAIDVYEWKANGTGSCGRTDGCLALISSGQGEEASTLYGMSADGHDVFFITPEKLVGQDIPGSLSIYDARVEGGIPDSPIAAPCQGDACQGAGNIPPALPNPASDDISGGGNVTSDAKPRCPKGKRQVRRKGKTRCVNPHAKKKTHHKKHRRPNHDRGVHR